MLIQARTLSRTIGLVASLSGLYSTCYPLIRLSFVSGFTPLQNVAHRHNFNSSMSMASANEASTTFIDKLALILINSDNKQLVARSTGKSVFYTPGGKREQGETDEEALLRECVEELSVNLLTATNAPATIESYGTFQAQAYGKPEGTMVRMSCYRVTPREAELELESLVKASAEIEELKWIGSDFDREMLTVTGIMILDDLKEKGLID